MTDTPNASGGSEPRTLTDAEKEELVRSTRRLDLRRILGGVFVLYGVITIVVGIVNFSSDLQKTAGIHINLWAGIGMLVGGLLFFLWDRVSPVPAEDIIGNVENEELIKAEGEGKAQGL